MNLIKKLWIFYSSNNNKKVVDFYKYFSSDLGLFLFICIFVLCLLIRAENGVEVSGYWPKAKTAAA